jgi:hypothetical protein
MEQEIALTGGRTTANVVRIGKPVRRLVKPRAAFAHELLRHLERRGFDGAPHFLGVDARAVESAQVALAERASLAGVREWADNCRAWVERHRTTLTAAIAAR